MNVIDSSAWISYFMDDKNASRFAEVICDTKNLLTPSIVIFEVFKKLLRENGETVAINLTAQMRQGKVIDVDENIAILAAKIGTELGLPMADSIIYAISWLNNATIYTCDSDFKDLGNVIYIKK